jgi:hypothetical protein
MARNNHNPVKVLIIKIIPKINPKFHDVMILDVVSKSSCVSFAIAALKVDSQERVFVTLYSLCLLVCCPSPNISTAYFYARLILAPWIWRQQLPLKLNLQVDSKGF